MSNSFLIFNLIFALPSKWFHNRWVTKSSANIPSCLKVIGWFLYKSKKQSSRRLSDILWNLNGEPNSEKILNHIGITHRKPDRTNIYLSPVCSHLVCQPRAYRIFHGTLLSAVLPPSNSTTAKKDILWIFTVAAEVAIWRMLMT